MKRRVTIRDIATEVGYHFTTVSMALRKHPSIPEKTRLKIVEVAERLGYRPDPVLSALMTYRTEGMEKRYLSTIAWVTNYPTRDGWRALQIFDEFYRGAAEEAERLGYKLEVFWLRSKGMTPRRLSGILRSRGIQGILLPPQPQAGERLALAWSHFTAVTFGYTLAEPVLHGVSNHHFRSMALLLEELFARGYRKCGYVEERRVDERVSYSWLGAYQVAHDKAGIPREIPALQFDRWSEAGFVRWLEEHRPEVIITKYRPVREVLASRGFAVPGEVGLASPSLADGEVEWSGMRENSLAIGRSAVAFLGSLLRHREEGVPTIPQRIMIEGVWNEGTTVRPRPQGAPVGVGG